MQGDLLPGERPDTCYLDDAEHWAAVYTELTELFLGHPGWESSRQMLDRYERRLAFWRSRLEELSAQPVGGDGILPRATKVDS
ncbi:MAG: hypothetical protein J2P45_23625 [Candidatus Dormibacteraeota bacterium]|nr:hypothetical protein [Candidatus Dormibacteraeota bacterium]